MGGLYSVGLYSEVYGTCKCSWNHAMSILIVYGIVNIWSYRFRGGHWAVLWTAIPGKNREIPQYRDENSMNTETAWMDKTIYLTEAAKFPKYRTKNTTIPQYLPPRSRMFHNNSRAYSFRISAHRHAPTWAEIRSWVRGCELHSLISFACFQVPSQNGLNGLATLVCRSYSM